MQLIHLYTSTQASPEVLNLALDMQLKTPRHVLVLPLSALPAPEPNRSRRQLLRRERRDVRAQLHRVDYFIGLSNAAPHKYGHQLGQLHLAAAGYQARLVALALELGQEQEGGVAGE